MSLREAKEVFTAGDRVRVTNHYITREDHPCYGTRTAEVVRVSQSGMTLEPGGRFPWPKADNVLHDTDILVIGGHPNPGDLFLTIERA